MPLPPSGIVTVRLAPRDANDIDALVEQGRFTSRSDFIRYAVKATLAAMPEPASALGAPLAGPGALGGAEAGEARSRGARRSTNKGVR